MSEHGLDTQDPVQGVSVHTCLPPTLPHQSASSRPLISFQLKIIVETICGPRGHTPSGAWRHRVTPEQARSAPRDPAAET